MNILFVIDMGYWVLMSIPQVSDGEESDEDGEQAGRGSGLAKAEL